METPASDQGQSSHHSNKTSNHSRAHKSRHLYRGVIVVLALLTLTGFVYGLSSSQNTNVANTYEVSPQTPCDDPDSPSTENISPSCGSNVDLALADTTEGCPYTTAEDIAAHCASGISEATLGDSTSSLTWPIIASEWPGADATKYPNNPNKKFPLGASTPIENCDLLYGTNKASTDNKAVSTGFQIMLSGRTQVHAAADADVVYVARPDGVVVLKVTLPSKKIIYVTYQNLKGRNVETRDHVKKGQVIGTAGPASGAAINTATDSLHFGVWNTIPINNGNYLGTTRPRTDLDKDVAGRLLGRMEHPLNYLPQDGRVLKTCKTPRPSGGYTVPKVAATPAPKPKPTTGGGVSGVCSSLTNGNILVGIDTKHKIYNYFIAKHLTPNQAAGIMANLYVESGLIPDRQQGAGVLHRSSPRSGSGYGLAQWTTPSRQRGLVAWAKKEGKPVGTATPQLHFLWHEFQTSENASYRAIKSASSYTAATKAFMTKFERPRNQSSSAISNRANIGIRQGYTKLIGTAKLGSNGCLVSWK